MSFVTTIRDYVEILNSMSDSLHQNLTLPTFVSQTGLYSLKTLQTGFFYIISFQWIRDFSLLPIVLPQVSAAILRENFVLESPSGVFFDFLEIPDLHQNTFFLGFLNSFFLALPLSVFHVVTLRRLFIQGIPAAVWSMGGYLGGQILFITCTVFGVRALLVPWLTMEPLNYLVGVILLFRIVYSMVSEPLVQLEGWSLAKSPKYKNFLITGFLLAWCEQTSLFQYLGNLTLSSNVTVLETFSTTSSVSSGFTHFFYSVGLFIGALFFTGCWGMFFLQLKNAVVLYTPVFLSTFIQTLNKTTFILALALSLTSIPFYGFEYVFAGPLGFLSQDSVFANTPFDENRVKDFEQVGLLSSQETGFKYLNLETAPFDRGEYLIGPEVAQPLSFEDLNYRGEFDWMSRIDKTSTLTESKSGFFSLAKVFQKHSKSKPKTFASDTELPGFNELFPKNSPILDLDSVENDSSIIERFVTEIGLSGEETAEMKPYQELYLKSFPPDFLRKDSTIEKDVEQKIKKKYYSNPVYKSLLALDIDLFLKRQPYQFQLTSQQEGDLSLKRRMLESYYDSLRHYANLPYIEDQFDSFFEGTKSFSSKVYNQQFKGTLRSVRRLFSLTLANEDIFENSTKTVLKFDQPQYEFSEKGSFSAYHEELEGLGKQVSSEFPTLPFVLNKPLYAGWDEHTRKFVITNKLLPRNWAGYKVNIDPQTRQQFTQGSQKQSQKMKFTAWPLSSDHFLSSPTGSKIPYITLFQKATPETREKLAPNSDLTSFPANIQRYEIRELKNVSVQEKENFPSLAPKRGGFVWPGNSEFQMNWSTLFQF